MRLWYLVRTKSSRESVAASHLARQGYETYLPRLRQTTRRGARWYERIAPLFPGYLFVALEEGLQPLAPVRSTVGVAAIVRFGTAYAEVPAALIGELRARADPVSQLHRLSRRSDLAAGAAVRIMGGAFDGIEGVFECAIGYDRVVLLLDVLGQHALVQVPAARVLPLRAA